jgi:hypothetical protein
MRITRVLSVLLFAASMAPGSPAFAAFAKAKFAKPDGVATDVALDFQDERLGGCDWKALGVAFPKRYDPDWKPKGCLVWSEERGADGKPKPFCLEPEFQAFVRVDRAGIDVERTPIRCTTSPIGWCSDAKYSARIEVVWARASLYGGVELCELDRVDGAWVFRRCRANGPVF